MRVIAYTYNADVHCPQCTKFDSGMKRLTLKSPVLVSDLDEHGLSDKLNDREGNFINPVFSTDEQINPLYCGDCGVKI